MLEALLAPISEEAPCGEFLKGNRTLYRGLRNSFNLAQSSFRQLLESPEALNDEELNKVNQQNWLTLAEQCEECLQHTSKDIEVLCWLSTARLFGADPLGKLAETLATVEAMLEQYWEQLQPMPPVEKLQATDEAGQKKEWAEGRIRPLMQLIGDSADSGLLYMPLQLIALVGEIDYSGYFSAEKAGTLAPLKAEAQKSLQSEKAEVITRIEKLGDILHHLQSIESKIGERCLAAGTSGLSFRFVKESIERLLNALRYLIADQLERWPLDPVVETPAENGNELNSAEETGAAMVTAAEQPGTQAVMKVAAGTIYNRDQAFTELRKIAEFFRKTEPHSPIYMLLERAIRWGYLSLPELLNEMVGDNPGVMGRITHMAGLESIEQTDIPAVTVSQQDILRSQPAAVQTNPSPAQTGSGTSKTQESSGGNSAGGLSSIEW